MKTLSFEKFKGLQIQSNSFQNGNGTFEIADNVVISRDDIVSSRRGFRSEYYFPENISVTTDYQGENFAIGNHVYRMDTASTGTSYSTNTSTAVVTRKIDHGLLDGFWITDFISYAEAMASSYPYRFADYCGQVQIITEFTLSGTASGTNIVITQADHGLLNSDTIEVLTSAIGATATSLPITRINSSSFYYTDATASGSGSVKIRYIDAFRTVAANTATASASGVSSWNDYKQLTGTSFTTQDFTPTLKTGKNLYWAANEGLHSIETTVGPVRKAGVPPALDTDCYLSGNSGGVAPNSQAAYRVVFGRKDANDTVHLGSPSDVVVVSNVPSKVSSGGIAYVSGTRVCTVTDTNTLSNADLIYLYNVVSTDSPPDGSSVAVTGVSGTGFVFDFDDLNVSPSTVTSLEWSSRKTATVYASIPSEITSTEYFYQIYRSESVDATVVPDARYKLLEQITLTAADIARGFVIYSDVLPFEIIQSNAELYTNPTQEGETQSNSRPPLCEDLELFKGYSFFANCTAYRSLALSLIQTSALADGDSIVIAGETYIFRGNATNASCGNDITTSSCTVSAGVVTVSQTAHGFASNDVIYAISVTGIGLTAGLYTITVTGPNAFTFATSATGSSGTVTYEGRTNAAGAFLVTLTEPSDTAAETIAEALDFTARSIVKACNRNSTKLYCQYVSGIDESPGRMLFTAKSLSQATFAVTASSTTVGATFSPTVPVSGTAVSDFQDVSNNALFCSKYLETEAVPIVNRFPIGSQDSSILRIKALRDSLIVMKEDGIFRLNGDSVSNFSVTALDTTVFLKAVRSAAVLNNSVYALTNQGVVQITDTSVRIVSRPIEPLLNAVIGNASLDAFTCGVGYESERLYILTTLAPNTDPSNGNVSYVYNYLTDCWTTWSGDALAFSGSLNIETDKLSLVSAEDRYDVLRERKNVNKIDYCGQDSIVQVLTKQICYATATSGTSTLCIQTEAGHGVIAGDVLSLSECDAVLAGAYTSGASSVNGLRAVTSATDKIICVTVGESGLASTVGTVYWQRGIQELDVTAACTAGSKIVTVTTSIDHGLSNGDSIRVDSISTAISAEFIADTDVTGFRPISVIDNTNFYFKADETASGNATGTINIRDRRSQGEKITMFASVDPQAGQALISDTKIYSILTAKKFDSGRYKITLNLPAIFTSKDVVYWHESFNRRLKFAPITMGSTTLKQFAELQCWFRNQSACSQMSINFSTDSKYSDTNTNWSTFVGTPEGFVSFGGWGSQAWGNFPWGGGTSVSLDFSSGPAVALRTWIPQESYLATFIQPTLLHKVAGETLELQSVSIIGKEATQKVTK